MDPSWCPGCDKLILPKRFVVPVAPIPVPAPTPPPPSTSPSSDAEHHPPPPPAPTPVPSSPEVRKKPLVRPAARNGPTRARPNGIGGGLVHGTGRVRPGGGLKPRPATAEPKDSPKPHVPRVTSADPYFPPVSGKKTRIVISQEPTPLYCSDQCRARDLKNSFLDSESLSFSGAPAALHHAAQLQRVEQTVEDVMKSRRQSASSTKSSRRSILSASSLSRSPPPVPPNTLIDHPNLYRTTSATSAPSDSKNSTIRASSHPQPRLRSGSFPTWGSPSKAPLAPPRPSLFTAGSSSSSSLDSLSVASAIFDDYDTLKRPDSRTADTCSTTPTTEGPANTKPRRSRNPLLDATPLLSLSLSPKDRITPPRTALTRVPSPSPPPALVVDTAPSAAAPTTPAMWPEDEKRTTECARVHGELLRGYARRFGPREGRSLVWGRLWSEREHVQVQTQKPREKLDPDAKREYWAAFEDRQARARARRRAAAAVQREEEERVIGELLGGVDVKEEDQPQARRMKRMAYDGMPGPAELRGLTYKFDRFLYPLMQTKPSIVERTVRRWDEIRQEWVEETTREEVYKKLFNFVED